MKVKVLKTGEVVEVVPDMGCCYLEVARTLDQSRRIWKLDELDIDYEYWEAFRREAAKDILCALLGRVERFYTCVKEEGSKKGVSDHRDFVRIAIADADELIKQLREEEK